MKIYEAYGKDKRILSYRPDSFWVIDDLQIGLEAELENPRGIRLPAMSEEFKTIFIKEGDGSLRDNGYELKFRAPLFGKDLSTGIDILIKYISGNHAVCNYRTGLHIHLDCRDLDFEELQRLITIYLIYEKSLFSFVGDDRIESNFCAPWGRINDHIDVIKDIFKTQTSPDKTRDITRHVERYSALNLNALHKFGSIEFRHMQMSKDAEKIKQWINIIMSIYKAASKDKSTLPKVSLNELIQIIPKLGVYNISQNIFPQYLLNHIRDVDIWDGLLLAQEFVYEPEIIRGTFYTEYEETTLVPKGTFAGYTRYLQARR